MVQPPRDYPTNPMVGVGVVVVRGGRILLVQRGKMPGRGMWAVPGGAVELGETAREAAAREALEETGISVDVRDVVWVADSIVRDGEGRVQFQYVIVDFIAAHRAGEPVCGSDAMDARWVTPEEALHLPLTATMPPLIERVREMIACGDLDGG